MAFVYYGHFVTILLLFVYSQKISHCEVALAGINDVIYICIWNALFIYFNYRNYSVKIEHLAKWLDIAPIIK
jgi:hypothetical protein